MDKRGLLALAFACVFAFSFVSAVSPNVTISASTSSITANGNDIYSYEVNYNYTGTTATATAAGYLGEDSVDATYGSRVKDGILSVYGSRLDAGAQGVNSNGELFTLSDLDGTAALRYAYFVLNDTSGVYVYYNNTVVDTTPPVITVYTPANGITYGESSVRVNFTATDNNAVDSLWYYNGSANVSYSGVQYINLSSGTHTFIFYANDSSRNVNSASSTFTVTVVATPVCGDLVCSSGSETCSSCAVDCGACPSTPSSSSGGGGGGSSGTTYVLESDTLYKGIEKKLNVGDGYRFNLDDGYKSGYKVSVKSIGVSEVELSLSNGETVSLAYGESKRIDLNKDSSEDIILSATATVDGVMLFISDNIAVEEAVSAPSAGIKDVAGGKVAVKKDVTYSSSYFDGMTAAVQSTVRGFFSGLWKSFVELFNS